MTGRLVDTHLGSYDCKLNTIEGSHCSTTKIKYILNVVVVVVVVLFLFCFFCFLFFFFCFCFFCCFFFYYYFRFHNVQHCSKIINSLSFYLLRYL